jgi:heat shock protein HslJ
MTASTAGTDTGNRYVKILAILILAVSVVILAIFLFTISVKQPEVTQDSYWVLESYRDSTGILIPVIDNTGITGRFGGDGILSGTSGCNNYSTAYLVQGKKIAIVPPRLQTQLLCPAPGIMQQESAFLADLSSASYLQTGGTGMKVLNNESRVILSFRQG